MARLDLTESTIRYAMAHTKSNRQAAMFLNVDYKTYRKYATKFIDSNTGLNLWDVHKNQSGQGINKGTIYQAGYYRLSEILEGRAPDLQEKKRLKDRLIEECLMEEKCHLCGFSERRIYDYKMPLLLDWINGDTTDHRRDNLRLLCYNCYFLNTDNVIGKKIIIKM